MIKQLIKQYLNDKRPIKRLGKRPIKRPSKRLIKRLAKRSTLLGERTVKMIKLKEKLQSCSRSIGSWISIGHPDVVEIMTQAGFEWLVVDLEHTSIDFAQAKILIATIRANDCVPLVRVGANDELIIKRVMDAGAEGVIVPMIKSAEQAQAAVQWVKYPPHGKRGVGLYAAQGYGTQFEKYKQWVHDESVVIAQIEHIDAVSRIDEILDVTDLDGIIVGPYDLSASMGYPGDYDRNDVKEALQRVVTACKKKKKSLGFHVIKSEAQYVKEKLDEGYNFLAFSIDFFFLGDRAREEMNRLNLNIT